MQVLCEQFPNAEHTELLRFCRARPHSVEEVVRMYDTHLQWRAGQGSAANLASAASVVSPKWVQQSGVARDGSPLFYVTGGAYNAEIGPEQHTLALAHAVDTAAQSLDESTDIKGTVLIDVRSKSGLYNVPATRMLPFFQMTCSVLQMNYPERLRKLILYPVPALAGYLWWAVKPFLDPKTAAKVEILTGNAARGSPCPEALGEFVALQQLPQDAWEEHKEIELHGAEVNDGSSSSSSSSSK